MPRDNPHSSDQIEQLIDTIRAAEDAGVTSAVINRDDGDSCSRTIHSIATPAGNDRNSSPVPGEDTLAARVHFSSPDIDPRVNDESTTYIMMTTSDRSDPRRRPAARIERYDGEVTHLCDVTDIEVDADAGILRVDVERYHQ